MTNTEKKRENKEQYKNHARGGGGDGAPLHWSRYQHYSRWRSRLQSRWIFLKVLWPMKSPTPEQRKHGKSSREESLYSDCNNLLTLTEVEDFLVLNLRIGELRAVQDSERRCEIKPGEEAGNVLF